MPENSRIEELRRRVQKDPASIAFAQLAEEHRRAGEYQEAIRVCRMGLGTHPGYLSARVTLGRALIEVGQLDEAQGELEQVVRTAPDNLAAIRALADIHQRRDSGLGPRDSIRDRSTFDSTERIHSLDSESRIPDLEPRISDPEPRVPNPESRIVIQLESWLSAIVADRAKRRQT